MGTAKTAVGGGLILATGLMGLGGVASAHTHESAPAPAPDQQASPAPAPHQVDANTPQSKGLIGVNAPVALDLHRGVANDLNVSDVARGVAVVGDVVPAKPAPQEHHADAKQAKSDDGSSHTGASVDGKQSAPQVQAQPDAAQPEAKSAPTEAAHGAAGGVANAALSAAQPVAQPVTGITSSLVSHVDQTVQSVTANGVQLNAAH